MTDDPEGAEFLQEILAARAALPARVHAASLPMTDAEENAAIVNCIQRHAEVVVQKSLAEGFGLTVAEALWKGRPVVASGVGGIQDQGDRRGGWPARGPARSAGLRPRGLAGPHGRCAG